MRLPHKLLGGRDVAQHDDCKQGVPPHLQRALCWRVPAFVQGDGSGSQKCSSVWTWLGSYPSLACMPYSSVCLLTFTSTEAGPGVQGCLLQGATMLLSPSEICFRLLQLLALRPCGT